MSDTLIIDLISTETLKWLWVDSVTKKAYGTVPPATATTYGSVLMQGALRGTGEHPVVQEIQTIPVTETPPDPRARLRYNATLADPYGRGGVLDFVVEKGEVGVVVDGGGSVPTTGWKGYLKMPYAGSFTGWTILMDQSGSCTWTVKKCDQAGFPATVSIVAAAKPTVAGAIAAASTTLTGWTLDFAEGDIFEFLLDTVATAKWIQLTLQNEKA